MNKTILFFLALVLAATTACGRGSSNNNPVKEDLSSTYKCNFLGADNKQ